MRYKLWTLLILTAFALHSPAKIVMILGDSISAGYGLNPGEGWVALLQERFNQESEVSHTVINASVSGETTAGALARLPDLLTTHHPDVVVIELSGDDGLRGQPPQSVYQNLGQLVSATQKTGATAILFGMRIPPNYGTRYSQAFADTFTRVAKEKSVALLPFFLDQIAGNDDLMQADQIHPNAKAQPQLLALAWPYIEEAL